MKIGLSLLAMTVPALAGASCNGGGDGEGGEGGEGDADVLVEGAVEGGAEEGEDADASFPAQAGIFQQHKETGRWDDPASDLLDGSVFKIWWNEIEVEPGRYEWSAIDDHPLVRATRERHKRLAMKFQLQGKVGRPPVPAWSGIPVVEGTDAEGNYASWPVYWDGAFERLFESFMAAVAARYDADEAIAYFWFDETACGYPRASEAWAVHGLTDEDGAVYVYADALERRVEAYQRHFTKPLVQAINKFRESGETWLAGHPADEEAMWAFAGFLADRGVALMTPSFYASAAREDMNYGDWRMIWPILRTYQDRTRIVVLIDRNHGDGIADPRAAIDNLFGEYRVDCLAVEPSYAYDHPTWAPALEHARDLLGR